MQIECSPTHTGPIRQEGKHIDRRSPPAFPSAPPFARPSAPFLRVFGREEKKSAGILTLRE